jgi:translocation and assembly module TamB
MSDQPEILEATAPVEPPRRFFRRFLWFVASCALLVLLLLGGLGWYATTDDFNHRVVAEVVKLLEDATGGRVELHRLRIDPWNLSVEADGLVIHGLEGPGEEPYLSAKSIYLRLRLVNALEHASGVGLAQHIAVRQLRIDAPHYHLMVDKDGHTNQPIPKHPTPKSNTPIQDTLLDLKAGDVQVTNGLALINDQAIPFQLVAEDLSATIHYIAAPLLADDRYAATVDLHDLRTQIMKKREVHSTLHVEAELGRDTAAVKTLVFRSGDHMELTGNATLAHFAQPEWQAAANGSLDLKQVQMLTGVDGLDGGTATVQINAHNCVTPAAAVAWKPKLLERLHIRKSGAAAPQTQVKAPDCTGGYLAEGRITTHRATYDDEYVRIRDVNASTNIRITPDLVLLTDMKGQFETGGGAAGEMRIDQWRGPLPHSMTTLTATTDHLPLRTIMLDTAPVGYGDLGFDTSVNGPVTVHWGGTEPEVSDTVMIDAELQMLPVGHGPAVRSGDIPVLGQISGHYDGKREIVNLQRLVLSTPQSSLTASGVLGVNIGDALTQLKTNLTVHDLSEYDTLLTTLGWAGNGRVGAKSIPVNLHGTAVFDGTAQGEIAKIDIKGHLEAENLEVRLGDFADATPEQAAKHAAIQSPPTDVHIDHLTSDAEYTPSHVTVTTSTIEQGSAVLHIGGSFAPRSILKHGIPDYVWDDGTQINATAQLSNANVKDVLTIAGQQDRIPVTGTIALDGKATGTLAALTGSGKVTLTNGVAYGEQYDSANVQLSVNGQEFTASQAVLKLHGATIQGNCGYNLARKHIQAHLIGDGIQLSHFATFANATSQADAAASFKLDANGTFERPDLHATASLSNVTLRGKPFGRADLTAQSEDSLVRYTLRSTLAGAEVKGDGDIQLTGDFNTHATLTLAGLNLRDALELTNPGSGVTSSPIGATITLSGPAKKPLQLVGSAKFQPFSLTAQGITLKTDGQLALGLRNGQATFDAVHITGPDTDLRATGNAQLFAATTPNSSQLSFATGRLDLNALGSINVALAHSVNPDFIAAGKITLSIAATGTVSDPKLTGDVQFRNVNLALDGIPNGLSNMNGTLQFNQNRLVVQSLTATTGGGQLKIGGFLTYRDGVFADLTASGANVRVRHYGLSATANSNLHLQGNLQSALLSGNILLTRFGIGQDADLAAFASGNGINVPADPSALSNRIRMDVHVVSSPQLDFQNSYAKLAGTVDLTVHGTVAEPTILGRIQVTDGSATYAGVKYQLQRGNVYFSNPVRIDPQVDLDVSAHVETYDLTIGLHGTASNLKTTYRSDPPLTEADIFSLLALGRTQEEAQIQSDQDAATGNDPTTNALLGGALNATVSNRVSKLFGGATVKIDPAYVGTLGGSSARITVQQQVSQQITFTYATNVNYTAQQLIQVAYQLTPNTSLVATRDESGVFSVVYKFRKRYR